MFKGALRYARRNPNLIFGLVLLLILIVFSVIGPFFVDVTNADPLSVSPEKPPSFEFPFGTDSQGRDLFAVMVAGTPLTLRIGIIAGFIGVAVGATLAFVSAYCGGSVDAVIRGVIDVSLTVPSLLVLIIVAVFLKQGLTVNQMALIVALLAWRWPARTIRAQVLTMRERAWVQVAHFSGVSGLRIIFMEMMPNLMPFLAAALVGAVASAILASIGLEALGLGPIDSPTLGMTIYWVIYYAALLHGFWWWWLPPIAIITILFVGLFNLAGGLDEIANPRLRKSV
jgi:peptide/nickel transport system permease protein